MAMSSKVHEWLMDKLRSRESEYLTKDKVRVFCGTWNVNGKKPKDSAEWLAPWLRPPSTFDEDGRECMADIYAVALQEVVNLNAVEVAAGGIKGNSRVQKWSSSILCALCKGGKQYVPVGESLMVGTWLGIFCTEELSPHIGRLREGIVTSGVLGVMGNKGAVGLSMRIYDSSVCFISAHLAAHRANVAARNDNYQKILRCMVFEGQNSMAAFLNRSFNPDSGNVTMQDEMTSEDMRTMGLVDEQILEHDNVFWMGDLNYRVHNDIPNEDVFEAIRKKDVRSILAADQLILARAAGHAFDAFHEAPINFFPTYKLIPGTGLYEEGTDKKKQRAPAWCDRVLTWASDPAGLQQLSYQRSDRPDSSDHLPVMADFDLEVKLFDRAKRGVLFRDLMEEAARQESAEVRPAIKTLWDKLEFGTVSYMVEKTVSLWLANEGGCMGHYSIQSARGEDAFPSWYTAWPRRGTLVPGEKAEIKITVLVADAAARAFAAGTDSVGDIVIVRVTSGQDCYVGLTGTYVKSCYGRPSVDALLEHCGPGEAPRRYGKIPKPIVRLVEAMRTHPAGLQDEGLFREEGIKAEVQAIRAALDADTDFPPSSLCSVNSYAESLVTLLSSLWDPVLPTGNCLMVPPTTPEETEALSDSFIEELRPACRDTFLYLLDFFRNDVLTKNESITAEIVAAVIQSSAARVEGEVAKAFLMVMIYLLETKGLVFFDLGG